MRPIVRPLLGIALIASASTATADASDGTRKFGDYLVHFNALSTQVLSPEMATQYSIERSAKRGMLNISVQKVAADGTATPVAAAISGQATNLSGHAAAVTIREIPDLYVSYVGLFEVAPPDTYTFTLSIRPTGSDAALTLTFSQNFAPE